MEEHKLKISKKIAPTWQRIVSGLFASMALLLLISEWLGFSKNSQFTITDILPILLSTYLFGYFSITGTLPKPFNNQL